MKMLYNSEFIPFVVVITSPSLEELQQLQNNQPSSSLDAKPVEKLSEIVDQSDRLLKSEYSKYFDLVIVNRNREVVLKKILDTLEGMRNESQWIPLEWLSTEK